jgi:hypothetical protein
LSEMRHESKHRGDISIENEFLWDEGVTLILHLTQMIELFYKRLLSQRVLWEEPEYITTICTANMAQNEMPTSLRSVSRSVGGLKNRQLYYQAKRLAELTSTSRASRFGSLISIEHV